MLQYPITKQCLILMHHRNKAVENIVRKGAITCNNQFLLFSQSFLHYMVLIFHFKCTLKCRLQYSFNLDQCKILSSGNGLNNVFQTCPHKTDSQSNALEPVYQTTNFILFQTERVCRRQFQI